MTSWIIKWVALSYLTCNIQFFQIQPTGGKHQDILVPPVDSVQHQECLIISDGRFSEPAIVETQNIEVWTWLGQQQNGSGVQLFNMNQIEFCQFWPQLLNCCVELIRVELSSPYIKLLSDGNIKVVIYFYKTFVINKTF